ncbi:MAG: lytic murein transglycosylase [Brucellaceae bacterium]|nr:lytic murein transglycosylase [Brucellaceae bacterium]
MKIPAALVLSATLGLSAPAFAQQCGGDFGAWKNQVTQEAQQAGIGQRGMAALQGARIDQKVLARDRAQGVFNQTFTEFSGRMINSYRLKNGAGNIKKYGSVFAKAEADYGVPAAVITAFWALETDFGAVQGDFNTLNAIITLAHDCRRPELFRPQIIPLLTLIDRGAVPANVTGAWAGEIGQTQMLPSDILTKGIDGDGDGRVDMKNSKPDVILTTANNIHSHGWQRGVPWMVEVRLTRDLPWEQTGLVNRLPVSQWASWGVTARDGGALPGQNLKAGLVLPQGHKGPAFLVYPNYDLYLEWNQSLVYTLTAANLATRLAGAPKFDPRNPEAGLDTASMKRLQSTLEARGYDVGGADGILGEKTRQAVRQEQLRLGFPADGWPTPALLAKL